MLGMITEKVLTISPVAKKTFTQGGIINLVSSDTERVSGVGQKLGRMLFSPIMIVVAMVSLYKLIGFAFFAGVGVLVLSFLQQIVMSRCIMKIDREKKKIDDKRLEITNQVFQNIKTVKLAAWEEHLSEKIRMKRN